MKIYKLVIEYNEGTEEVEFIEESITEDAPEPKTRAEQRDTNKRIAEAFDTFSKNITVQFSSKAKNLGLIDGIGNAHEILKDKFGDDVVIKKFQKSKCWLSQKLSSSNNQFDQLANMLDERSIWQRYGL